MKINNIQDIKTFINKFKKEILQYILNSSADSYFIFKPKFWHTPFDIALQELKTDNIIKNLADSPTAQEKYMNPSYMYVLKKDKRVTV